MRDVPACHDLRVVGSGIGAGPAVLHDRMDHAKQLVGWGDDGPLVTLPRLDGAEAAVELAFLGPGGGARALNEDRPEHGIVVPGVPAPPPAAALVVSRANLGPSGAVPVRGEDDDVGGRARPRWRPPPRIIRDPAGNHHAETLRLTAGIPFHGRE